MKGFAMEGSNCKKPKRRKLVRNLLGRCFRRDQSGAGAVEFGLVAAPFIFLLLAIFEVGLHFLTTLDVEYAVEESARLIRTGQIGNGYLPEDFRAQVCQKVVVLKGCEDRLKFEVTSYDNFETMTATLNSNDTSPEDIDEDNMTFEPGQGGSVVLVRVFFIWEDYSLIPGFKLSNLGGSKLIQASMAFRNEPFPDAEQS